MSLFEYVEDLESRLERIEEEMDELIEHLEDELGIEEEEDGGLPVYDGHQMVEEVYSRHGDPNGFVVYRDEDGDGWIRCGDSWSCFLASSKSFAEAIREANR